MNKPKVALIHDYLVQYGGAEKTLEALLEIFPDAPIYTSFYKPELFPESITSRQVITAKKGSGIMTKIPILSKYFTFLIPLLFENLDLDEYDIIISNSSAYAKGVLTKPDQLNICYVHTPPRFMYKYSVENTKRTAWYYAPVVRVVDHLLRMWDFQAAQRPDYLLANSKEIRRRVRKFYRRDATVIYPPVQLAPESQMTDGKGNYYLIAGRLVAYKNFDVVVKAFNELPQFKLKVFGTGPELKNLKKIARENVEFVQGLSDEDRDHEMQKCKGLVNAVKDEDFGIIPIEVLSHGNPVLAHRSAGHLETVIEGVSGMYFDKVDLPHLKEKILDFDQAIDKGLFDPAKIIQTTRKFSKRAFQESFVKYVEEKWEEHLNNA